MVGVGKAARVYAIAGAVIVGIRGYFLGVKVTGYHWPTRANSVIIGRMSPALISVFDNAIVVDMQRPASYPGGEMVSEGCAVDIAQLRGYLSDLGFKPRIVVSQTPESLCIFCRSLDLQKALLAHVQLFLYGRKVIPTYRWVPRNTATVKNVPVHHNGWRL
jgi:hypothetical protein